MAVVHSADGRARHTSEGHTERLDAALGSRVSPHGDMLVTERIRRTGRLERVVFNENGEDIRREALLGELQQRIRDVRQGPDGLPYLLTEANAAALLRIEPIE